jgi:hypothetical protein
MALKKSELYSSFWALCDGPRKVEAWIEESGKQRAPDQLGHEAPGACVRRRGRRHCQKRRRKCGRAFRGAQGGLSHPSALREAAERPSSTSFRTNARDLSQWRKRLGDKLELLLAECLRVAHQSGALRTRDLKRVTVGHRGAAQNTSVAVRIQHPPVLMA